MDSVLLYSALAFAGGWGVKTIIDSMKDHHNDPLSVDQLLNYQQLIPSRKKEGYLQLRDGCILATFEMGGVDLTDATDLERKGISYQLNRWLKGYGDDWAFWITNRRIPVAGYPQNSSFNSPAAKLIDEIRKDAYNKEGSYYQSKLYLSVVHLPEGKAGSQESIEDFDKKLEDLTDQVGGLLKLNLLPIKKHLSFLYDAINFERQEVTDVGGELGVDSILASQDLLAGFKPKIGAKHFQAISITGFPPYSYKGVLDKLDKIDCPIRWTSRVVTMGTETQKKLLKKKRSQHAVGGRDLSARFSGSVIKKEAQSAVDQKFEEAYMDDSAYTTLKDISNALSEMKGGETGFAQFTSTILLFSEDQKELKQNTRKVTKVLKEHEFTASVEYFNNVDAWRGSLPGHAKNIRRTILSTYNIADIISTSSVWGGRKYNPSQYFPEHSPPVFIAKAEGSTPYFHHRPSASDVGHSMLIGDTGSGKSVYANFEIAQWNRFPNSQSFVFDNGYSGQLLCEALGGAHYDLVTEGDSSIGFQPFKDVTPNNKEAMQWAVMFIQLLFNVQGEDLSPKDKAIIDKALRVLAEMDVEDKTLSTLCVLIQDHRLKEVIKIYTSGGNYSILDSNQEIENDAFHQVFELSRIEKLSDEIYLPVLMYLFHRVDKSLDPSKPTLVYVEESWQAFKNPIFANYLKEKLLTWRKYNAHLCLIVHKPSQLAELPGSDIFIDSAPDKVFLPNPNALSSENQKAYKIFGLNDADLNIIATAQPKRQYYIKTPEGSRLFDLNLDPVTLSLITDPKGMTLAQRQESIQRMKASYGEEWPAQWLREQGKDAAAEAFIELQGKLNKNHKSKPEIL